MSWNAPSDLFTDMSLDLRSCVTSLCQRRSFPFPFFYWALYMHFPSRVMCEAIISYFFFHAVNEVWLIKCRRGRFCDIAEEESGFKFASFRDGVIQLRPGDQQLPNRPLLYKQCARETMQAKPRQVCLLIKQNKMNDVKLCTHYIYFSHGLFPRPYLGWNLIISCGWGRESVLGLLVKHEQCRRDL